MIRVIRFSGGLLVQGHADFAPRGQDLVCAAVSILTETLRKTFPTGDSQMGEGFASFRFAAPSPEVEFVCRGLRLLEKAYPFCICFQDKRR